jgi:acetyltransferase
VNTPTSGRAGPETPRWTETLEDGRHVVIRPVTRDDASAESAFIEALSPASRRYRFLGQIGHPSALLIRQLTQLDYKHQVAFAAVTTVDGIERFVGVSRYSTDPSGAHGEFAVTVADAWQNKGLGTLLMKHLIEVGRDLGVRRMLSIDLAENIPMRELAMDLGFEARPDPDDAHQVIYELAL